MRLGNFDYLRRSEVMDKEIENYISFILKKFNAEYPRLSQELTCELNKVKLPTHQDRKIQKIKLIKSKYPDLLGNILKSLNSKFGFNVTSGYKVGTFFNSPYIMSDIHSRPDLNEQRLSGFRTELALSKINQF